MRGSSIPTNRAGNFRKESFVKSLILFAIRLTALRQATSLAVLASVGGLPPARATRPRGENKPLLVREQRSLATVAAAARAVERLSLIGRRRVAMAGQEMIGAQMVLRALVDQGVEHVFGYPGGAVLPIYDEIFKQNSLRHILVRHEQGAVHAAEGYARSTGKVGVVLVTSGPGATNAVTGLTDALMDSVPIVCLTG